MKRNSSDLPGAPGNKKPGDKNDNGANKIAAVGAVALMLVMALVFGTVIYYLIFKDSGDEDQELPTNQGTVLSTESTTALPSPSQSGEDTPTTTEEDDGKLDEDDPLNYDRAIERDPNGETVYDRWKPNIHKVGTITRPYWGDAFYPPVDRKDQLTVKKQPKIEKLGAKKGDSEGQEVIGYDSDKRNAEGDEFVYKATQEILTYRARNYSSLDCAIAGARNLITTSLREKYLKTCRNSSDPMGFWESLMEKNVIFYPLSINQKSEGFKYVYDDTSKSVFRLFSVKAAIKGGDIDKEFHMTVNAKAVKTSNGWRLSRFEAIAHDW